MSRSEAAIRIGELSLRSGVPVATIKFYIREGLLPRGEVTAPNQARYDERHLRRLELIGTLQRTGLSLAVIGQALRAMEGSAGESPEFMLLALGALPLLRPLESGVEPDPAVEAQAAAMLRAMAVERGWHVDEAAPIWDETVRALTAILSAWPEGLTGEGLGHYAAAAEDLAAFELADDWNPAVAPADTLAYVVLGTALFEPLILDLRRMAHVDRSYKLRMKRLREGTAGADVVSSSGQSPDD